MSYHHRRLAQQSFNLLSEILFVQANTDILTTTRQALFQSLERDSVCSSDAECSLGRAAI